MIKYLAAAFILAATPAMADTADDLTALINMSTASQFCGYKMPPDVLLKLLSRVAIENDIQVTKLADIIDAAAVEQATNFTRKERSDFCGWMANTYTKFGFSLR